MYSDVLVDLNSNSFLLNKIDILEFHCCIVLSLSHTRFLYLLVLQIFDVFSYVVLYLCAPASLLGIRHSVLCTVTYLMFLIVPAL